jgi:hypothetical protein
MHFCHYFKEHNSKLIESKLKVIKIPCVFFDSRTFLKIGFHFKLDMNFEHKKPDPESQVSNVLFLHFFLHIPHVNKGSMSSM